MTALLVVNEDGLAKRLPLTFEATNRARHGLRISPKGHPLADALLVEDDDELVISTASGKVQRIAASDVPFKGRRARGVALSRTERVTAVAVAPRHPEPAAGREDARNEQLERFLEPGRVALREGEEFADALLLHPPRQSPPGGKPVVPSQEWAQSEVHTSSAYWCGHCGEQLPDPHAVYEHIDAVHGGRS